MTSSSATQREPAIDFAASAGPGVRTLFGERVRTRIATGPTAGQISVLDYWAPAGFGPPRHIHHKEDEILDVLSGQCVVWTPARCSVLEPGDVVFFPRGERHAWRAFGPDPLHLTVTVTPGGMENLFLDMSREGLDPNNLDEMMAIGDRAGVEVFGPPLSDDEVRQILDGATQHRQAARA